MAKKLPIAVPGPARLILDFIGTAEAPNGYVTIFGNRQKALKKPLTAMTIGEVIDAQKEWSSKVWASQFGKGAPASSAAGRYQFMRATLIALCKDYPEISGTWLFDGALQDRLGFALLIRRGYYDFVAGRMSVAEFGLELAREWASFPVLEDGQGAHRLVTRGQSYYAGDGVNKALVRAQAVEDMLRMALSMHGITAVEVAPAPAASMPARLVDPENLDKPLTHSKTFWQWLVTAVLTPMLAVFQDWRVQLAIVVIIAGFAVYAIKRRADIAKVYRALKVEDGDGGA